MVFVNLKLMHDSHLSVVFSDEKKQLGIVSLVYKITYFCNLLTFIIFVAISNVNGV